jgi:NADPH-dependent curcumin reductase CurA
MRGGMNDGKWYAAKVELGEVMIGGGVGEIVAERKAGFAVGKFVSAASSGRRTRCRQTIKVEATRGHVGP